MTVLFNPYQTNHYLADEGSLFSARSPTPGTGLATVAAPTSITDDTKPFLALFALKPVAIMRVRLMFASLGGGTITSLRSCFKMDAAARGAFNQNGGVIGGSVLSFLNRNGNSAKATSCQLLAGANTAPTATASMQLYDDDLVRSVSPVVGDRYEWRFGTPSEPNTAMPTLATVAERYFYPEAMKVAANTWWFMHLALAGQTSASALEVQIDVAARDG
jgi:hypothetical protein